MPGSEDRESQKTKSGRGPFRDILEIARLLSSGTTPEKVIETVLIHLQERLGKRSRCALLEGDDLRLRFWAGEHSCPVGGLKVDENSVVWDAVRKGVAINLTNHRQANGFSHSLAEPIVIKAVIPLAYADPLTGQTRKLGALIVDSGQAEVPVSDEDFEYLQVIGGLISAILERADLIGLLMTSCRRQEEILMQTAHNFRNSIAIIGGFSRRIATMALDKKAAEKATHLHEEVKVLEGHLARFEEYMKMKE